MSNPSSDCYQYLILKKLHSYSTKDIIFNVNLKNVYGMKLTTAVFRFILSYLNDLSVLLMHVPGMQKNQVCFDKGIESRARINL